MIRKNERRQLKSNFSENADVFLEGLKSDCRSILVSYFEDIQVKIVELFVMVRKNNETQIKGEKQLEDSTDSLKFMFSEFDEYKKERLERQARLVELESKVVSLSAVKLEYKAHTMKQYSRHNSIPVYGLPEVKGEDTDSLVIETVNEKMGLDIVTVDIDRTHQSRAPLKQSGIVRRVIVKFVRHSNQRKNLCK